jgi:hypothetical protein
MHDRRTERDRLTGVRIAEDSRLILAMVSARRAPAVARQSG